MSSNNQKIEDQSSKCAGLEERCFLLKNLIDTLRNDNNENSVSMRNQEERIF